MLALGIDITQDVLLCGFESRWFMLGERMVASRKSIGSSYLGCHQVQLSYPSEVIRALLSITEDQNVCAKCKPAESITKLRWAHSTRGNFLWAILTLVDMVLY